MEVGIKYDDMDNEIYEISKTQLVIRDEKFKLYQLISGSYEFQKEVLKKDYKEIKANNRKRLCCLVEFDRKDKIVIKLVHRDDLKKEEEEQQKIEDKYLLKLKKQENKEIAINNAKSELRKTIRILEKNLENIKMSEIDLKEIDQFNTYLLNVGKKIKIHDLKDITTTKQINKKTTITLYKNKIHKYVLNGNYFSINQMCKDLKISRKSFYNYKLNEYLKELI